MQGRRCLRAQEEPGEVGMQRGQLWCPVPVKSPSLGG